MSSSPSFDPDAIESDLNYLARTNSVYNQMKCPQSNGISISKGAKFDKIMDSVIHNGVNYAVAYPFSGVNTDYKKGATQKNGFYDGWDYALGSNYYYELGMCNDNTGDAVCRGKPRWVYVRNIPVGKAPLMLNASFEGITGSNLAGMTENRGIVGGLLEDISDIQPLAVMEAATQQGNYGTHTCKVMNYPVGTNIYDDQMKRKTWDMESRCSSSYFNLETSTNGGEQKFPLGPKGAGSSVEGFLQSSVPLVTPTTTTTPSSSSTSVAWIIPFVSIVAYLCLLPSTR